MHDVILISLLLILSTVITSMFLINVAVKFPYLFGECKANQKTSMYHEKMIRGLGILFPLSLMPVFFIWSDYFFLKEFVLIFNFFYSRVC